MKKFLALAIALIMTFATVTAVVGATSENNDDVVYLDASLNEVVLDGTLGYTVGKSDVFADDKITLVTPGTAPTAEYVMDNHIGSASIGAAWSMTTEKLYIAVVSGGLSKVGIEIGGKSGECDVAADGTVTGISGATAAVDGSKAIVEIAIPLEDLEIKHNGRYVYTDIKITVDGATDNVFDGALQFTDYSANFVYNKIQQTSNPDNGATGGGVAPTVSGDKVINLKDDIAENSGNVRLYSLFKANAAITLTKNIYWEMDMNIRSMPATTPFNGGPDNWPNECSDAHLWCVIRNKYEDQFYFNIINTADDGIVMLIQAQGETAFLKPEAQKVVLGKLEGETFRLKIEWSEENLGIISVDGKEVYRTERTAHSSTYIGKSTGILFINTGRVSALGAGEKIDVDVSNVSVGVKSAAYSERALVELIGENYEEFVSTIPAMTTGTTEQSSSSTETTKVTTTTKETTTAATETEEETTTAAATAAVTTEAEKKGCGSSLVGYGAVMIVGGALMTVLGVSKKREE